jgi:hypothetical protein
MTAARLLEQQVPALRTLKFYNFSVLELLVFICFHENHGWGVGR